MFAEVLIPLALPLNFTWSIPEALRSEVRVGVRVEVNLGRNKRYAGIVKSVHARRPEHFQPKEIISVLDPEPVVQEWQLKFWEWMASYYMCTEGEVLAAGLPAHFKLSSETVLVFNEEHGEDFSALGHDEYLVAEALLVRAELKMSEVQEILQGRNVYPVVNRLINQRVCFVWETLREKFSPRKETIVILHSQYENEQALEKLINEWGRAPKQLDLLLAYLHYARTEGGVTRTDLLKKSGASEAILKGLVEKDILILEKRSVDRIQYGKLDININFNLNTSQGAAVDQIRNLFSEKPVCLLHGVTSSGKTHVYVKLMEEALREGKQVLYMLPEIALTAQIIRRLKKHFGTQIGIYHSRFSQNERVELWQKVRTGEVKIVLGARSSIFLPFRELGLIICDEEHDSSFKQHDPAPRYHARDAAIYMASLLGCRVLLGSATPSLESYHNASTGKYGLVNLAERFGDVQLPSIEIIDTRLQPKVEGQKAMLTEPMMEAIRNTLSANRQVILFQNRRGYAPYQICGVCGWIAQCENCDVSLTYHKFTHRLKCHYCGSSYPTHKTCPACGSDALMQKNFGTERIEEMIQEQLQDYRIARMDLDTARSKNGHDQLIQQFEQHKLDVLVGTQMVVKGLDFEFVDLVGIVDADSLLSFADFRVNERAFQLMEQVSGRAGRREARGRVMIQTMMPAHPVLRWVADHDFRSMFNDEISKRKEYFYPPFSRLIHLSIRHKEKDLAHQAAERLAFLLHGTYANYLIGPAEPPIARVRNLYFMELMLKLPRDATFLARCKEDILKAIVDLRADKAFKSVTVIPDVDRL